MFNDIWVVFIVVGLVWKCVWLVGILVSSCIVLLLWWWLNIMFLIWLLCSWIVYEWLFLVMMKKKFDDFCSVSVLRLCRILISGWNLLVMLVCFCEFECVWR